jgi:hypothetical protein
LTLSKAVKNTEMYSKQKKILFVGLERHISIGVGIVTITFGMFSTLGKNAS